MNEKPILMSAPMVLALLNGSKTQTRRVIKPQPPDGCTVGWSAFSGEHKIECRSYAIPHQSFIKVPYGTRGDRLWVRETFQFVHANSDGQRNTFKSSVPFPIHDYQWIEYAATPRDEPPPKWKPSIFMPRWASRITLEIVSVRVERLQDISEADAKAEGCRYPAGGPNSCYAMAYMHLWEAINGENSWSQNPWVWCISFIKI